MYPALPAPEDPDYDDGGTTAWAWIIPLLILLPPLGWMQLARRRDVRLRAKLLIAGVAAVWLVAAYQSALNLLR